MLLIDVPEKKPPLETKEEKKVEEKQISVLDDLFRKTKATPSIYWLPLSEEEVQCIHIIQGLKKLGFFLNVFLHVHV